MGMVPWLCSCTQVEQMADGKKLVVMINPQWHGGQVISDFGLFGRKKKEDFVNSFETSYSLQTKRIAGEDARCFVNPCAAPLSC